MRRALALCALLSLTACFAPVVRVPLETALGKTSWAYRLAPGDDATNVVFENFCDQRGGQRWSSRDASGGCHPIAVAFDFEAVQWPPGTKRSDLFAGPCVRAPGNQWLRPTKHPGLFVRHPGLLIAVFDEPAFFKSEEVIPSLDKYVAMIAGQASANFAQEEIIDFCDLKAAIATARKERQVATLAKALPADRERLIKDVKALPAVAPVSAVLALDARARDVRRVHAQLREPEPPEFLECLETLRARFSSRDGFDFIGSPGNHAPVIAWVQAWEARPESPRRFDKALTDDKDTQALAEAVRLELVLRRFDPQLAQFRELAPVEAWLNALIASREWERLRTVGDFSVRFYGKTWFDAFRAALVAELPELEGSELLRGLNSESVDSLKSILKRVNRREFATAGQEELSALLKKKGEQNPATVVFALVRESERRNGPARAARRAEAACAALDQRPATALGLATLALASSPSALIVNCQRAALARLEAIAPPRPAGQGRACAELATALTLKGPVRPKPLSCKWTFTASGKPEIKETKIPVYETVVREEDNPARIAWDRNSIAWSEELRDLRRVAGTIDSVDTERPAQRGLAGEVCDAQGNNCKPRYQGGGSAVSTSQGWKDAADKVGARIAQLEEKLANKPPWKIETRSQRQTGTRTETQRGHQLSVTGTLTVEGRPPISASWNEFHPSRSAPGPEGEAAAFREPVEKLLAALKSETRASLERLPRVGTPAEQRIETAWLRLLLLQEPTPTEPAVPPVPPEAPSVHFR